MKRYLIDTHILIWAILGDAKLSPKIEAILKDMDNEIFVSQISLFEIAIKQKLKKLPNFNQRFSRNNPRDKFSTSTNQ